VPAICSECGVKTTNYVTTFSGDGKIDSELVSAEVCAGEAPRSR
jgi:uncharacterized OB-fold protein